MILNGKMRHSTDRVGILIALPCLAAFLCTPAIFAQDESEPQAKQAVADSGSSSTREPIKFSIGAMSFTGDSIKLTKSEGETFECKIDGHAEWALGHDGDADIALAAKQILISRDANSKVSIRCAGDCKLTDSDITCTADRMQVQLSEHLNEPIEMQMFDSVRIEYGDGDHRTTLTGESVAFQGGTFHVSGTGSLKRGS